MSPVQNEIVSARIELTFATGHTVRYHLDNTDQPINASLKVEVDVREVESHGPWLEREAGPRLTVDLHIAGRGPRKPVCSCDWKDVSNLRAGEAPGTTTIRGLADPNCPVHESSTSESAAAEQEASNP